MRTTVGPMRVTETIHHGDYYNVRTVDMEPTFAGLVAMLQSSPYGSFPAWGTVEDYASNRYVAQLLAGLLTRGRGELGWATYVVEAGK